jgi:hypothetical protein
MIMIGRTQHSAGGILRFGYYHPEPGDARPRIAMWVSNLDGEREYVATCITGSLPEENHVHLKWWSENAGVPEALAEAGAVTLTGASVRTGHVAATVAKLTPAALAELAAQNPPKPPSLR